MSKSRKTTEHRLMWCLDLDQICAFIFDKSSESKAKAIIKETYGAVGQQEGLKLKEKVVTEDKGYDYSAEYKAKADIIRWLLDMTDNIVLPEGREATLENVEVESMSEKVALNTLYRYGFIN